MDHTTKLLDSLVEQVLKLYGTNPRHFWGKIEIDVQDGIWTHAGVKRTLKRGSGTTGTSGNGGPGGREAVPGSLPADREAAR